MKTIRTLSVESSWVRGDAPVSSPASSPEGRLWNADTTRRLAEIAFIGAFAGRLGPAETIFRSLLVLCPGNPHVQIGLAMVWTICGKSVEAAALLDRVDVATSAERGLLTVCTAIALRDSGHRSAADRMFADAIAQGGAAAEWARGLAQSGKE
jgi:predicted Zn-dependent protease